MSTLWRRAVATTTIALVAGLGITACSFVGTTGPNDTKSSSDQRQAAARKPMTQDDFAQRVTDAMSAAKFAHITQSISTQGQEIASSGDVMLDSDPKKMRMHLNMSLGAQKFEMVLVDATVYMNMGAMTQDKYVRISTDDANPMATQLKAIFAQSNTAVQMKNASAAVTDFAVAGAEKVDGVDTTHYVLALDAKKLLAAQGVQPAQAAAIGDTIAYDLYIDGKDLVRRVVMDMGATKVSMDYSKWGERARIEAPAADQLIDVPGL